MRAAPVILDNTPLVALWGIGQLELLNALYGEVWIPPAVYQEFLAHDQEKRQSAFDNTWLKVVAIKSQETISTFNNLDRGEAEVLALASEHKGSLVIIDERKARRYAKNAKLLVTGTLGVLLVAKENGFISEIKSLIEQMQLNGLHYDPKLVESVLTTAGE